MKGGIMILELIILGVIGVIYVTGDSERLDLPQKKSEIFNLI